MKRTLISISILLIVLLGVITNTIPTLEAPIVKDDSSPSLPSTETSTTTKEVINPDYVVKDFEGEADPKRMKLNMTTWRWVKTTMNDGKVTFPKKFGVFTLTFKDDKTISITTDCNGMGGTYALEGNKLTFGSLMATQMYCEGSQEQEFAKSLTEIGSYLFTSKGELILEIKMDSGTMVFR